jgi:hypothetical protein
MNGSLNFARKFRTELGLFLLLIAAFATGAAATQRARDSDSKLAKDKLEQIRTAIVKFMSVNRVPGLSRAPRRNSPLPSRRSAGRSGTQ